MRTSLMVLASLLLLVLATTTHGSRLDKHLHEALNNKELAGQPPNGVAHSTSSKHCTSDGHCSGKAKKPLSPHAEPGAAKHLIAPKRNDGDAQSRNEPEATGCGGQEEAAPRVLPRHRQPQQQTRTYPDLLDVAGMDYSPTTRKPPIHN